MPIFTMDEFIRKIPKAELHLHIEGTLEPNLLFALAERNGITLPYKTIEEAFSAYKFTDLQSFLNVYYTSAKVLVHEQDFYDLTWAYLLKADQQNIRHVEIFFDPQTHTRRNIPFSVAVNGIYHALSEAEKQFNISSRLIMCFLRDLSETAAEETLIESLPYKGKLTAVGLDSGEIGNPPDKFREVFERALDEGFLTVAHAGEEGPPDYIWQALELLKVSRIDHGVACIKDPQLIDILAQQQIPLTICPLSNLKLHVFKTLEDHPLKKLLDLGICATVNSDDPAYLGGDLVENFLASQRALHLTRRDIYQLTKNAFTGSFLADNEKQNHIQKLDEFMIESE
jgi:adenosine deaminase